MGSRGYPGVFDSSVISLIPLIACTLGSCYIGMRLFWPTLQDTPAAHTKNYSGRTVVYGLGIVWLFWAIGLWIFEMISRIFAPDFGAIVTIDLRVVVLLVVVAFVFGFIDDTYGSSSSRGFKGHIKSLFQGKLTTGGLKLFGIGFASLYGAYRLGAKLFIVNGSSSFEKIAYVILVGFAIALTSNLLNLTDLRPGRASKVYGVLAVIGLAFSVLSPTSPVAPSLQHFIADATVLLVPVFVVVGLDVREKGMLGDAGANAMGVLVGAYILTRFGLNFSLIAIYLVLILLLNLMSEKISFSKVIEGNKFLSKLDNLGRLKTGVSDKTPDNLK